MLACSSVASLRSTMPATPPSSDRTILPQLANCARDPSKSSSRTVASATAASVALRAETSSRTMPGVTKGWSPGRTTMSSSSVAQASSAQRTAWPVPRCSVWTAYSRPCPRAAMTSLARWPTTIVGRGQTPSAARSTRSIMGTPATGCRTLGRTERMRLPLPAARMMTWAISAERSYIDPFDDDLCVVERLVPHANAYAARAIRVRRRDDARRAGKAFDMGAEHAHAGGSFPARERHVRTHVSELLHDAVDDALDFHAVLAERADEVVPRVLVARHQRNMTAFLGIEEDGVFVVLPGARAVEEGGGTGRFGGRGDGEAIGEADVAPCPMPAGVVGGIVPVRKVFLPGRLQEGDELRARPVRGRLDALHPVGVVACVIEGVVAVLRPDLSERGFVRACDQPPDRRVGPVLVVLALLAVIA